MLDQIRVTKKREEDRLRQALMGLDEMSAKDNGEKELNVSPLANDGPLNLKIDFGGNDENPTRSENITPNGL